MHVYICTHIIYIYIIYIYLYICIHILYDLCKHECVHIYTLHLHMYIHIYVYVWMICICLAIGSFVYLCIYFCYGPRRALSSRTPYVRNLDCQRDSPGHWALSWGWVQITYSSDCNSTHSKALVALLITSLILQVTDHGVQLNTCRKLASQHWLFLPVM